MKMEYLLLYNLAYLHFVVTVQTIVNICRLAICTTRLVTHYGSDASICCAYAKSVDTRREAK